jgi:hypothetical protein
MPQTATRIITPMVPPHPVGVTPTTTGQEAGPEPDLVNEQVLMDVSNDNEDGLGVIGTVEADDDDASTDSANDVPVPATTTPVRENLRFRGRLYKGILG